MTINKAIVHFRFCPRSCINQPIIAIVCPGRPGLSKTFSLKRIIKKMTKLVPIYSGQLWKCFQKADNHIKIHRKTYLRIPSSTSRHQPIKLTAQLTKWLVQNLSQKHTLQITLKCTRYHPVSLPSTQLFADMECREKTKCIIYKWILSEPTAAEDHCSIMLTFQRHNCCVSAIFTSTQYHVFLPQHPSILTV